MTVNCGYEHSFAELAVVHQSARASRCVHTSRWSIRRLANCSHSHSVTALSIGSLQSDYVVVERVEQVILHQDALHSLAKIPLAKLGCEHKSYTLTLTRL